MTGPLPTVDKFAKGRKGQGHGGKGQRRASHEPGTTLLVHRLPPGTTAATVTALFVDSAEIKPATVSEVTQTVLSPSTCPINPTRGLQVEFNGAVTGRCHVTFRSQVLWPERSRRCRVTPK